MNSYKGQAQTKTSNKKALLIGVGAYPGDGGWASLNSKNDMSLIQDALKTQGFLSENICTISDDQATKQNIIATIKTKLIKEVKKGDIIYFHFSGHGQQKPDLNGDEVDGYDECIVPFDSPKKYKPGIYEGENLITDDELHALFQSVRKQLTSSGQLIVALDACHSGTGTRGAAISRGSSEPMASSEYINKTIQQKQSKENNEINSNQNSIGVNAGLAPMIAFFGSAQNQVNYEMTTDQGQQFGSLSYALSKYLVESKKDESYRGLFDKIKIEMSSIAPLQQPQAEGDLDTEILNGKALGSANYYKVISASTDEQIVINAGFLQSVNEGSVVGFFPRETRDIENTKAIVLGKIAKSMTSSSVVTLDSSVAPQVLHDSWVYILEKSMGSLKIAIDIQITEPTLAENVKNKLFSYPFIVDDAKNAKLFIAEKKLPSGQSQIVLNTIDNYILDSFLIETMNAGSINKLTKKITQYLQGLFLRKLELVSEDLQLRFEIIPIDKSSNTSDTTELVALKADADGQKRMRVEDQFKIQVINDGIKPAYFNLIDIQPDNMYTILLPDPNQTAEEMRILPNQKKLLPLVFVVWPPRGNELFKLVASSKPLDLRSAYGTRGNKNQNPFEKLFDETGNVEFYRTRGGKPTSLGNMEINTYTQSFIIAN
ncbi:MAG: caspase family protein [Saprospiraceae bacterium]|nr:caspase family protein [Saprospiraceae bacterium]MBK8451318.1 caspase family protein [Saprospiraceae bacterium]MBK9722368.1 caspase family protein [Saprospiraceae bacterium]